MQHQSVLVYNITHADLILGVRSGDGSSTVPSSNGQSEELFCKPKFSQMDSISQQVLGRFASVPSPCALLTSPFQDLPAVGEIPVGFTFPNNPITVAADAVNFRNRLSPANTLQQVQVVSAYIPLAAQLIPAWYGKETPPGSSRYIFLICGAGRPQDDRVLAEGNSTRYTAELIAKFLLQQKPTMNIQVIDSSSTLDLFDYSANVQFVRDTLVPMLESIRRRVLVDGIDSWHAYFDLTVALTQGSPARMQALSAALTPFKPKYAHMRQLKTFWLDSRLLAFDLEFLSNDEFETLPAIRFDQLGNCEYKMVVEEMRRYRDEFTQVVQSGDGEHELASFWLRKSFRPVLSVLMVSNHGQLELHRGINLEVSQPTGSLCSERNAIGTALSVNPKLQRKDFRLVAVLALDKLSPNPTVKRIKQESLNPLGPCGACMEWLKKITDVNPDFKVMTFVDHTCDQVFVREVV
ncbi:hypothetical protein BASA81_004217 [Batrachochytrium salamandrivorans]|nr:hypothetical protein BASA81_004217 [Batrachochytrium salamandrivorans]